MTQSSFKSILITGASSGIGAALALQLAGPGIAMTITGRDPDRLQAVKNKAGSKGSVVDARVLDVTDLAAMSALIADIELSSPLDLVIANAGISSSAGAGDRDGETTRQVFAVNLAGVLNTVLPSVIAMRVRGRGHIAIISSIAGFRGMPTAPAYSASKVAVKAWGEAIRPQLSKDGIGLSMIFPGFVESRITDSNTFPMPFLMPAQRAAQIIVDGLRRGKRTIAFPWQMIWMMRLLTALPGPIYDAILSRAPKKST
ncbi:MAG: SDR family NAD(P)-dependent oxidoreductase [Rhodospirillales bacterium]